MRATRGSLIPLAITFVAMLVISFDVRMSFDMKKKWNKWAVGPSDYVAVTIDHGDERFMRNVKNGSQYHFRYTGACTVSTKEVKQW